MFNTDLGNNNSPLPSRTRGKIYNSLVLMGILLYGCESWVLTEMLRAKRNSRRSTIGVCVPCAGLLALTSGLSAEATRPCRLRQRLGIPSMQLLISTRKLRWAALSGQATW